MYSEGKAWPSEVFRPVFQYVQSKCPKLTARRTAKITKAILAAQEALDYAKSRNRQEVQDGQTEQVEYPNHPERRRGVF